MNRTLSAFALACTLACAACANTSTTSPETPTQVDTVLAKAADAADQAADFIAQHATDAGEVSDALRLLADFLRSGAGVSLHDVPKLLRALRKAEAIAKRLGHEFSPDVRWGISVLEQFTARGN